MKEHKARHRAHFLQRRQAMDAVARRTADAALFRQLAAWPALLQATAVGAYVSDGTEPDLSGLFDKRFRFPRWNGRCYEMAAAADGWCVGRYGLMEPVGPAATPEELQAMLWLIPGVAFDESGARLGRGGGWYDRLLAAADGVKVGIFYACQQAEALPVEEHDCRLDWIVTENGIRCCRGSRMTCNNMEGL